MIEVVDAFLPGDHGESLSIKLVSETGNDMAGTYVVPFLCRHDRTWQSVATKRRIEAIVIGCEFACRTASAEYQEASNRGLPKVV